MKEKYYFKQKQKRFTDTLANLFITSMTSLQINLKN